MTRVGTAAEKVRTKPAASEKKAKKKDGDKSAEKQRNV